MEERDRERKRLCVLGVETSNEIFFPSHSPNSQESSKVRFATKKSATRIELNRTSKSHSQRVHDYMLTSC